MILYFVRHGETDWNVKKKIQGKTDVPLNATGKQQAKACGHASGSEKGRDSSGCAGIYIPTASCSTDGTGGGDRA